MRYHENTYSPPQKESQLSQADENSHSAIQAEKIAESYDFQGDALELGSVVISGEAYPKAQVRIPLAMMNRHGLIAGATGTGKTKTLQLIAESLSSAGVPVFLADIKGDLSGLSQPGKSNDAVLKRAQETGETWEATAYPTEFTSLGDNKLAIPLRAKIDSFGPILLSKVLRLNETQESTLGLIFHWAETKKLDLYELKDLRAVISYLTSEEGKPDLTDLGGVSKQSAGVILRAITVLENDGGNSFFGEPEIQTADLMRIVEGKGVITLCELSDQASHPTLFSTFLMWVLSDLFHHLPEIGDIDKPKLVFIFDEAHTLFSDASKNFINLIVQTVKLIRSKGVGIFFCSQSATDIPNDILSQLGARIQHALRAFTPEDQKALTKTVKTFPITKVYNLSEALTSLGIGEAIITVLSETGSPTSVAWTRLRPPQSYMGDIGRENITHAAQASGLWAKYAETIERNSAYDELQKSKASHATPPTTPADQHIEKPDQSPHAKGSAEKNVFESIGNNPLVKNLMSTLGTTIGREISRNIFGKRKR